jgi:epoxide hydrolase-like predicted phosphatase
MRALIVDFGGVLTTNVFDSFREFAEAEGIEPDAVKELFRSEPAALALLRELEKGELTSDAFSERFAPYLGVEPDGLVERLFAGMRPDEAMLGAVRTAHDNGVKTGLISNSWGEGLSYDRTQSTSSTSTGDELAALFDDVVISGEVGLHKPQPEIYELSAQRLGVAPPDCIFVDDLRENCAGAEAVGMSAVLHRGANGTLPRLEEFLRLSLQQPAR